MKKDGWRKPAYADRTNHGGVWENSMKVRADISTVDNGRDKILSVCQCDPKGGFEHEVIIQRGPKEYDWFDKHPGPRISFPTLNLDIVPGPEKILFSGDSMTIILTGPEDIEVDISRLTQKERDNLKKVARLLFE